jgi:hypothetical protein
LRRRTRGVLMCVSVRWRWVGRYVVLVAPALRASTALRNTE